MSAGISGVKRISAEFLAAGIACIRNQLTEPAIRRRCRGWRAERPKNRNIRPNENP
jgi:hypothetical protein